MIGHMWMREFVFATLIYAMMTVMTVTPQPQPQPQLQVQVQQVQPRVHVIEFSNYIFKQTFECSECTYLYVETVFLINFMFQKYLMMI